MLRMLLYFPDKGVELPGVRQLVYPRAEPKGCRFSIFGLEISINCIGTYGSEHPFLSLSWKNPRRVKLFEINTYISKPKRASNYL